MRAYSFPILAAIAASACGFPTVDIAPAEGTTGSPSGSGSGGHGGASATVTSASSTTTVTTNGSGGAMGTTTAVTASSVTSTAQTASTSGSGGAVNCDVDKDNHKSKQCGGDDCDDNDDRAYPGQIGWFSISPTNTNKDWDFNCDNMETQEFTMADVCNAGGQCPMTNLYVGIVTPPACGMSGPWGNCESANLVSCAPKTPLMNKVQACH